MYNADLKLLTKEIVIPFPNTIHKLNEFHSEIKKKVEEALYQLTDSDYNGSNGERLDENEKSKLENHMDKFYDICMDDDGELNRGNLTYFIKRAIYDSCEEDEYYIKLDVRCTNFFVAHKFIIVIAVAQMVED